MRRITTNDLVNWAATRDCQQHLPLLIRKLIRASPVKLMRILIPAGDNIILPGYDGTVETDVSTEYIPEGLSVWEIGAGKDYKTKAEGDYQKRSEEVNAKIASKTTFVFVTPRIWQDREDWEKQRAAKKRWKDVKVIDGSILEEWIEEYPIIGAWLAKLIGLAFGNIQPLDEYWKEWRENISYSIAPELVVAGRDKELKKLSDFLFGAAGILSIKASTQEEAIAFIGAATVIAGEEISESLFSKAVLVTTEEDFRLVSTQQTPVVIIANFPAKTLADHAVKKGHHVLLPVGNDVTAAIADIELSRIRRDLFEKQLQSMGFNYDQADQLTRDSGQSLSVLRRLLYFERNYQPEWAKDGHHTDLIPGLLAGSWDEEKEADKALIELLAGENYEKYIARLSRWKLVKDPPVFQIKSIWHFTSYLDAWSVLTAFITRPNLENLKSAFMGALPEINPALELLPDQRWLAKIHGKTQKFSSMVREGLCQSLILIAVFGERFKLTATDSPQGFADSLIRELLENATGDKWNSLSRILPLLAEASPRAFLNAAESSIAAEDQPVMKMFGDVGSDPLFSSQYFTWLLRGIENLMYSKEYLLKATLLMGRLATIAPKGKILNSPASTLKAVFIPWYRQTDADFATRKIILIKLAEKEPEVAWDLFVEMMPNSHGSISPIHRCRWRWDSHQLEREVSVAEVWDMYNFLLEQMIVLARGNEKKTAKLISMYPSVDLERRKKVLAFLRSEQIDSDYSNNIVWEKLRKFLARNRDPEDKDNAIPEDELKEMEELFTLYTPQDPLVEYLYLFENDWIDEIDGVSVRDMEHEAKEELVAKKRLFVFKMLYEKGGINAVTNLIPRLTRPNVLSHTAVQFGLPQVDEELLLGYLSVDHNNKYSQFIYAYIWARSWGGELPWVSWAWDLIKQKTIDPEILAQFFLSIPLRFENWKLLESVDATVQEIYWRKVQPYISSDKSEEKKYVITKLMDAGRYLTIIDNMSYGSDDLPSDLLIDILLKAATSPAEPDAKFDGHDIKTLFQKLHSRSDTDPKLMSKIEWLYLPVFPHSRSYQPKTLHKALTEDPNFFVDVVCYVYMPDEKSEENYTEESLKEYFKSAGSGRTLLDSWYGIPGMSEDGSIDKKILTTWVKEARVKGKEKGRVYGVDSQLGKLFGCYPRKSADSWPPDVICEIMEELNIDNIFSSYRTEIFNSRGIYGKSPYEGGGQERGLASFFETAAKRIESSFPATAGVLRDLSRSYQRDAKEEDDRGRLDELR